MSSGSPLRITAVMACHNRKDLTVRCVASLKRARPNDVELRVIVADDGSTDGTASALTEAFPDVVVLPGPGDWFWCGGMRAGLNEAYRDQPDFVLWLNDDVELYDDFLVRLLDVVVDRASGAVRPAIVAGAVCDPQTKATTFGGRRSEVGVFQPSMSFPLVPASADPEICDTMNGNVVLVPREVYRAVGTIHPTLVHNDGDFDYGLRASKAGFAVLAAPGHAGECEDRPPINWSAMRRRERWRLLRQAKGEPFADRIRYYRAHAGRWWFLRWATRYVEILQLHYQG